MFEQQLKYDLFRAYYSARQNKRNTWNQLRFEIEYERNLLAMQENILNRTYTIRKSIAFVIHEPVQREIFAADFSDRVVHHLIFNYINPILEPQFIEDSYSCRLGKGTHYGVARMSEFLKMCSENYTKDCYVLKLDIKGYFMSMNKHLLWQKLETMLDSARYTPFVPEESSFCWNDCFDFELVWWLMEKVIWNDPKEQCTIKGKLSDWDGLPPSKSLFHAAPDCGLPIGNLTSQLFSNVYLHDFDSFVKNDLGCEYYGRYVDDFVIIHRDKGFLLDVLDKIKKYLAEHAALKLHPNKIYLQHYAKGFPFLGVYIKPYRNYINNRTKKKFYQALERCEESLGQMGQMKTQRHEGVKARKDEAEEYGVCRNGTGETDETGGIGETDEYNPLQTSPSKGEAFETVERKEVEKVRATLNSYLGIMKHHCTYNLRRKALLKKNYRFFDYGFLTNNLEKYQMKKRG